MARALIGRRRRSTALAALLAAGLLAATPLTAPANAAPASDAPASAAATSATGPVAAAAVPAAARADSTLPVDTPVLTWSDCGFGLQCASFPVPRSYQDPGAGTIRLAVLRRPADRPAQRIGSLVVNPGGPGGSGVDLAAAAEAYLSPSVLDRYDVVGFDPRGVGRSDPIACLTDAQTDRFLAQDPTPDTAAERRSVAALSRLVGRACQQRSPRLVAHVGTRDVARDMDLLRAALGDERLHYLGFSYGTSIGSTYAEMFPARVGRFVLDGAIDPSLDLVGLSLAQARGFERALTRFAADCPRHADCPLPRGTAAAVRTVRALLRGLDARPLPGRPGRPLTEGLGTTAVLGAMYDDTSGWPALRDALRAALRGNGRPLLDLADLFTGRLPGGGYESNGTDALYAVSCWDYPSTPGVAGTRRDAARFARVAPTFGAPLAWSNLPCGTWPGHSTVRPHRVRAPGTPPILVVGTRYDPATPVGMAKALARQLSRGVFLEWVGDGHTAYGRGSRCVTRAVDTFLLRGVPPADGTVCR